MQLPCICFYGLKTDAFPPPQNEGRNRISTYIDAKYFRDFADNASPAEIAALPPKKQPAIAVIKDWAEFVRRLKAKLNSIGVPDECILVSPVQYFDFSPYSTDDSWVDLNCTPPKELFVKSKQDFEYQNELRIVIDTDDPTILDLLSNPIEIGNLSDIAAVAEGYHPEGIEVTATFNSYIVPCFFPFLRNEIPAWSRRFSESILSPRRVFFFLCHFFHLTMHHTFLTLSESHPHS